MTKPIEKVELRHGDALLVVHIQNDFLPGGALPVPHGDEVIPVLNTYIRRFQAAGLPVFATRDWHPPDHCSFQERGGPWPPHCIAGSPGAAFAPALELPKTAPVISQATEPDKEAYSGFQGTELAQTLRRHGIRRLFIGGLATDYCVLHTVLDALKAGFEVYLLKDAVRAVDVHPGDGARAVARMEAAGAVPIDLGQLAP